MTNNSVFNALMKLPMYASLGLDTVREVSKSYELNNYPHNKLIFAQGDFSDRMFILISGEVAITRRMGIGERKLKLLQEGDWFGEMGIITHDVRSASARAVTDVVCLELTLDRFSALLETNLEYSQHISRVLIQRIKDTEISADYYILQAYESLLFSLSNLAEARSMETGAHLHRVRDYCKLLAEKLSRHPLYEEKISPFFIENIYIVSPVHDIGKVAIPDAILHKKEKLTAEETLIMQSHTWKGANVMLKLMNDIKFPTFEMAYNVVIGHHERYDGRGYPLGLKGSKIPLEARIMSLADVFDALRSKRSYKPEYEKQKVYEMILNERGKFFDPLICDTLLDSIDEFESIYQTYPH